jgi:3-(3-hydroxy-phenyl)propionate hydroxylase
MRTAVLSLAARHAGVRSLINPRQTSAIAYQDSPLNAVSDDVRGGPAPGTVLPECPLTIIDGNGARRGHVTDLVGPHFTAFYFGDDRAVSPALAAIETSCNVPFMLVPLTQQAPADVTQRCGWDHTARLFPMYGATPGTLYLVRPDGHVLGRWQGDGATLAQRVLDALAHALRAA